MKKNAKDNQNLNAKTKPISNTMKISGTAIFSALAFIVSFLEFPIFPLAHFLKLDFSAVFVALSGFIFGPVYGIITCVIKELLCLTKSSTGGVGEIANAIVITGFIIVPTLVYKFKKGLPVVILTFIIGCFIQTVLALLSNKFVLFPLYMGEEAGELFASTWVYVLLFNLIKSFSNSVITILLYKRISHLIKKF